MDPLWKALVLRAIGLFLFFQWITGNLVLYIHERFAVSIMFAAFTLLVMGAVYHTRRVRRYDGYHHHHGNFSWGGLFFVLLPIMMGLLAPRKPLGSEAMRYRSVDMESLTSLATPGKKAVLFKLTRKRTILDWVTTFLIEPNVETFTDEKATVSGFVYRDTDFPEDTFMVSRFVITCCVADAVPVGLYVYWPEGTALKEDQWIEVSGRFELREIGKKQTPVLMAEILTLIDIPDQPYLYP